jgi:hypothetical protein
VAEWLKATDCKSVAPWSYGGSNPPLCTSFVSESCESLMSRFWIALSAYLTIGILAWFTLSDQKIRLVTVVLIAMFALRTLTLQARRRAEERSEIR